MISHPSVVLGYERWVRICSKPELEQWRDDNLDTLNHGLKGLRVTDDPLSYLYDDCYRIPIEESDKANLRSLMVRISIELFNRA